MRWPWSKKTEVEEKSEAEAVSELIIYGIPANASYVTPLKNYGLFYPYKNFVKWFHSRPQSESFAFKHTGGQRIFLRKNITSYEIRKRSKT